MKAREPIHVPSLSRRHLPRPRLTRLLDASKAQAILLIAPAGFGKTSLACEWLSGREDVYWYRATSASADLAAFSVGIAEVLAAVAPEAAERLRQRVRVGEVPEKAARPLAEMLAEDLADWPPGGILVVDDYHLVVDSAPVEEFVDWLLTYAPDMRVLVTTRRRPAWASARRVMHGHVMEIAREQLAMTDAEATDALSKRPSRAVQSLVAQADGWPAIVGLACLASAAEIPPDHVSRELYRYLADEVVRQETTEAQAFMLVAAIPHAINTRIAREILGFENAEALIQELTRSGLLHPSGPTSLTFHPLLRDFLIQRLEREQSAALPGLVLKLIDYARTERDWDMAIDLARSPQFLEQSLTIVTDASIDLLADGRVETLERWLSQCGPAIIRNAGAVIAKAEISMRRGLLAEAAALIEIAMSQVDVHPQLESRVFRLAGQIAHLRSQSESALAFHRLARDSADNPTDQASAIWGMILAAGELESERVDDFLKDLESATSDDIDVRLRIAYGRTLLGRLQGSLEGAWASLAPLVSLADYASDPMIRSGFLSWTSFIGTLAGRYERAASICRQAEEVCERYRLGLNKLYCTLTRCHALIGANEIRTANATLEAVVKAPIANDDAYIRTSLAVLRIRAAFANGQSSLVASGATLVDGAAPPAIRGELRALISIAAAAQGDSEAALNQITAARQLTRTIEVRYLTRYADLILRVVSGDPDAAGLMDALVRESAVAGVSDAYVTAYRACPAILQLAKITPETETITRTSLAASHDHEISDAAGIGSARTPWSTTVFDTLSAREREVLLLIADGASNAEVARRLVIAESTAKVHVHHILRKLGVPTRLQAALLSRDLPDRSRRS